MGSFGGSLPINAARVTNPAGSPAGPTGKGGVAPSNPGSGWEIFVVSYQDYTTVLCQIPPKLYTTFTVTEQLDDIGSGNITLNQDDPWWKEGTLTGGLDKDTILDFECLWRVTQNGVTRFEFFGETITEQLVDPSEQRTVTVSGPGTIAALKWGMSAPEGFPNIILKLDGLVDDFDEVDSNGNAVLDTNIWNAVSPAADVYITPVQGLYSYPGGALYQLSTLYPSGTLTIEATGGTTYLGSVYWDATDTLISAQISPVGAASTPTDASGNPEPYGAGMDGSELTQFYIQSASNSSYYAMIGLSHGAFYCQIGDTKGVTTKTLKTYDPTNDAYWMITEQGGTGGGSGTFYFWTSADGQTWTQQWSAVHHWNATKVAFYITATYDSTGKSALVSNLNSNVTTPSYQGNIYLGQPIMGIYKTLLDTAKARGTIPFIAPTFSSTADSYGKVWTDSQNVQVTNGTDLYSLLQSFCSVVNADYIMKPGFKLVVGQTEQTDVSLGVDRSQQIIFREGHDCMTRGRTRTRNQIVNLVGAENNDGREISASDSGSITDWGQREGWYQTAAQVDPVSMEIAAAASAADQADEILTQAINIVPGVAGKTVFQDFSSGDWIGLERPDFSAVDALRVLAIAVTVDQSGAETNELTLQTYMQYLEQELTYLANKLGGQFINALGTTPVAPSKYGTGQVPTYFNPASSLGSLKDVVGTSGNNHGAPLVWNAATGQWQPAGSADSSNQSSLNAGVQGSDGTVTVIGEGGVTVTGPGGIAPDGGGSPTPVPTTLAGPTGYSVVDSDGVTRVVAGLQDDGSFTTVDRGAGAPSTPDTPTVAAGVLGVIVSWDGLLGGANPLLDFQWVEVHCSSTSGFTPTPATLQGTMSAAGLFGVGGLTAGTTYYIKLVAYNTSGTASPASTQASAIPNSVGGSITPGSINGNAIVTGTITSTQIATNAGILGSQLSSSAGIVAGQVSFTARNIGGITTYVQSTAPTGALANDLWFDSANGYKLNQYNGTSWQPYQWGTNSIQANSITAALIAAGTITATQIASGTITAAQIQAGTITASLIASATITGNLIAAGTITGNNIQAGTITANLIASASITAGLIAAGAIDGLTINGVTINGNTISAADVIISSNQGGLFVYGSGAPTVVTYKSSTSFIVPANVTSILIEAWGGGGGGGGGGTSGEGGSGGGGEYAADTVTVTPGATLTIAIGAAGSAGSGGSNGGDGGTTTVTGGSVTVTAHGGQHGVGNAGTGGSAGGSGSTNGTHFNGGAGVLAAVLLGGYTMGGNGGGGSGGPSSAGNQGNAGGATNNGSQPSGGSGAPAVAGGGPGGNGGPGAPGGGPGQSPSAGPGGGGGSGGQTNSGTTLGAAGFKGQVRLTYTASSVSLTGSITGQAGTDPVGGLSVPEGASFDNLLLGTQATFTAQGSAPSTPSAGALMYGSGTGLAAVNTSGLAGHIPLAQAAFFPGNTITGTSLGNVASGTYIAGDAVGGAIYEVEVWGNGTWGSTAQTLEWAVVFGGTAMTNFQLGSSFFSTSQAFRFRLVARVICQSTGASAVWSSALFGEITESGNNVLGGTGSQNTGGMVATESTGTYTVSSLANQALSLQAAWGSTTGASTLTSRVAFFRRAA